MNGAQSLVQTLVNCGVEPASPIPARRKCILSAALDSVQGMRPVLCLFEGVATGAADGYGRIAGKPAATLLHLGPGWPTASPICTTPAARRRRSSTSSAITRPTICNMTRC